MAAVADGRERISSDAHPATVATAVGGTAVDTDGALGSGELTAHPDSRSATRPARATFLMTITVFDNCKMS
ncbi:hypothetical protein TPB0596_39490 [Tsukamurella pulmonis]|nr:hypothetical protein TPB0596_39490 [Tsukamurella pulmonis]